MVAAASAFLAVESSGRAASTESAWMAVMASPFGSPTKCARIAQAAQGGGRVRHVIHNRSYASDILTIGTAFRERNVSPSNANKLTNPVKERLRAGDVALGITVRISRTPDIARIA